MPCVSLCCCKGSICTSLTSCGKVYLGTAATVSAVGPDGKTIGPCTPSGTIVSLSVTPGSGYTNGTNYALIFSGGGGTGAAGTFRVVGGQVVNVVLTSGGTGYTSAPTVSFANGGAGTGAVATATMALRCCIPYKKKGNYTVTATGPCGSVSSTIAATCNQQALTLALPTATITFNNLPNTCGFYASGQITLTGPDGYSVGPQNFGNGGGFSPKTINFCAPGPGTYTAKFTGVTCNDPIPDQTVTLSGCSESFSVTQSGGNAYYPFHATVCGADTAGVQITATPIGGGSGGGSATTDGSGNATITGLTPGCSYNFTASYDACPTVAPATVGPYTASCGNPFPIQIALGPVDGYDCCSNQLDSHAMPIPETATLSGPGGSFTIPGSSTACGYTGCITIDGTDYYVDPNPNDGTATTCGQGNTPVNGSVAVRFNLVLADNSFNGTVTYRCCELIIDGVLHQFPAMSACSGNSFTPNTKPCNIAVSGSLSRCPLNASITVSGSLIPGLNGTWTLTE